MNEMKEAVGNWREAKQFSPADENDFLRWLDKADTEEKLFSRLTFWFTFRGLPADQNQRYHLVQERARELRLWNGLELKLRRWQDRVADEYEQIGKEAFAARIGEDYADYINSLTDPEAAPQQAAPEPETAKPTGVQAWSARVSSPGRLLSGGPSRWRCVPAALVGVSGCCVSAWSSLHLVAHDGFVPPRCRTDPPPGSARH